MTAAALYFHRSFNPIGAPLMEFDAVQLAAAGKTTLAAVAAGVLVPTGGVVRIGGVDIRELGEARTRSHVALLSQERVGALAGSGRCRTGWTLRSMRTVSS